MDEINYLDLLKTIDESVKPMSDKSLISPCSAAFAASSCEYILCGTAAEAAERSEMSASTNCVKHSYYAYEYHGKLVLNVANLGAKIEEGLLIRMAIASQFIQKYIMPLSKFYDISVRHTKYLKEDNE